MATADCVYEILRRDILGNCSLCMWKRLKFKTSVAKMFLMKAIRFTEESCCQV